MKEYEATNKIDVTEWRRAFPKWVKAVFAYPSGWQSSQSDNVDPTALAHLNTLGQMLRFTQPRIQEEGLDNLQQEVDKIDAHLHSRSLEIPADLRRHLVYVLSHVKRAIEEFDKLGEFNLQRTIIDLRSTLTLLESEDKGGKWDSFLHWLRNSANVFQNGLMGSTSNELGQSIAQNMLPSGS